MEAEGKAGHDEGEHEGEDPEDGEDILEEDDVLANAIQKPHVKENVEPGKGDCDSHDLPLST